jgi:glycosyltransferase involved in cell wall biosynthesis
MPRPVRQGPCRSVPMRILFVKDRLHDTGGTLYYLELLRRLDRARVTPYLCAFASWHPIATRFEAVGIKPTFFGRTKWDPRCLVDLIRFARHCKADLLHLEGATRFPFGRLGVRALDLPVLLRFQCMLPMPRHQSLLNRWLISTRWMGIAVSEAMRRWAIQELGVSPRRLEVLHTGLDFQRFTAPPAGARDRVRNELGLAGEVPVIGLVGRLALSQKGQDVMIRALRTVRERHVQARLLLAGDGPDRARCARLAASLGLTDAVVFAGHRHDVEAVLAAVDVVVVPSVCEDAFPLVALQALAAGRPVVASRSGGLVEVVLHEETGLVVPKGDALALAAAVDLLLSAPELAGRLAANGQKLAGRFTLEPHLRRLMAIYEAMTGWSEHAPGPG